ncbi:MAG: DinB family protein [Aggregatilineales bacterium]
MPDLFDFSLYRSGDKKYADLELTQADLRRYTNASIDHIHEIIADASDFDVTFVPDDPIAKDIVTGDTLPWTLGHVIVHTTASAEEGAALALNLARGVPIEGRSRYETYWETVTTIAQVIERLEESHRMRLAMLDAWPNPPHLDMTWEHKRLGLMNAPIRFLYGLLHEDSHYDQLREIMRQAKVATHQTV